MDKSKARIKQTKQSKNFASLYDNPKSMYLKIRFLCFKNSFFQKNKSNA